jgi:RND family efflux transporter MFP subunit
MRGQTTFLALALFSTACGGEETTQIRPAEDREVAAPRTAAAAVVEVPDVITLNGTLLADEESNLAPLVAGRVVEVMVERGQRVEEGQELVRLRDTDFRLQQQAARAQLEQAEARLGVVDGAVPPPDETAEVRSALAQMELADEQFRRAEELAQRGVYSQAQLDEARARAQTSREQHRLAIQNARGAAASLASARAQLRQASTAVTDSVVRAPFAGEIASRNVSVGEYVGPQAQLVTLVRTDPLRLELEVPEARVLDVRPGQRVEVRLDAVPDRPYEGTVRYVSASVNRQSRALTVEAMLPNPEGVLRPGMFANARIDLGRTRRLVSVPRAAILESAGVQRAFVVRDGRIAERIVTIAEARGDDVIVESGLSAGDQVAVERVDELYDGAQIARAGS